MATVVGNLVVDSYNQLSYSCTLGNADTSIAGDVLRWCNKWAQAAGTFGGATVTIEGSNDGVNFITATSDGTTALTFAAAGIKKVWEGFRFLRAKTAGGAGTSVVVTICGSA